MKDACVDLMQILKDPCKDLAGTYLRLQDKNSKEMGEDPARSSSGSI